MGLEIVSAQPAKCLLLNIASGELMECLFNPTQLSEKLAIQYSRLTVPGLSHQVLQYQSTGNRQLTGVQFFLDRIYASVQPGGFDIDDFRAFLRALTVPPSAPAAGGHPAPPRTLFVWPNVLTIEAVLSSLEFQYRQLATDGSALVYAATCNFEEILDVRVTSEALRAEVP